MTDEEYQAIRATFPWRRMKTATPGSNIQTFKVVDKNGNEVPIFDMIGILELLTGKLAR